jgi:hypothetical protein
MFHLLVIYFYNNVQRKEEINTRIKQAVKVISCLKSTWLGTLTSKETKGASVEIVSCYGYETKTMKGEENN